MNQEILLSYTEFSEDDVQNVLDIDPAKQPSQRMNRRSQILRGEFLALPDSPDAPLQRNRRLLQQLSLPLPADQAGLTRTKIILRERNQGRDQLLNSVAAAGRNGKVG